MASIAGVLIWPLYYAGIGGFVPQLQHPRIMIFGFGLAFVIGFMGTAWPRFLESAAMKRYEITGLIITWSAAQTAYVIRNLVIGDSLVALTLLMFLLMLGVRARQATSFPPPGFALAFGAIVIGLFTATVWALFPLPMSAEIFLFTKLAAYQGLLLLPLLGVGSYLFPRFFSSDGEKPIMSAPRFRAFGVWGTAILILVSFIVEANGWVRSGNGVRFLAVLWWAGMATPAIWRAKLKSTRAWALRIGIYSIALSFLVRAIWPGPAYAFEHLLFLGGFGLSILLVADRVSIGHGGEPATLHKKSKLWQWIVWLLILTIGTRLSADFKASIQVSHYIYAAILWGAIAVIWTSYHHKHWKSEN